MSLKRAPVKGAASPRQGMHQSQETPTTWPQSQKCSASQTTAADLSESEIDLVNVVVLFYSLNGQIMRRATGPPHGLICMELMRNRLQGNNERVRNHYRIHNVIFSTIFQKMPSKIDQNLQIFNWLRYKTFSSERVKNSECFTFWECIYSLSCS